VGSRIGAQQVGVDDTNKPDWFTRLLQLLVDAGVVTSEGAHSDHGDIDSAVGVQGRSKAAVAAGCRLYLGSDTTAHRVLAW